MRPLRVFIAVLCAGLLVVILRVGVTAMAAPAHQDLSKPASDPEPLFTRLVTVTVEQGALLPASLASVWQHTLIGFPVGPLGFTATVDLPTDSTAITASVSNGEFSIIGTSIQFRLFSGQIDFGWSYRTNQKVARTGNQYQIDQLASSNTFFRYIGTIFFPAYYPYVGSINFLPESISTDMLHWNVVVPETAPFQHTFDASSWLADPDAAQPDLSFTAAAMSVDTALNPPIAHLTATIRNNNDVDITSTNAFLEFYDRASPSTPPTSPLDHDGGWCGSGAVPVCPTFATFTNPVPSLGPNASATIAVDYPLTNPGVRDYYLQIDTFGGPLGLNFEFNETNNVYSLTRGLTIDYLESIAISGPVTGTAHILYSFDALVSPTLATNRPLTYTWLPAPLSGQGTAHAAYAWTDGDPHQVTVTARNEKQIVVTGTHVIALEVPLSSAVISGPITVSQNIPHVYQVSTQPLTATQPLSFLWEPEPDQGQGTAVATYTLVDLGEHLLTVYANNPIGPVVNATHIVVSAPPLAAVTIEGPTTGSLNTALTFTATVDPADAATPVSYTWSPAPASGQGTHLAIYQWALANTQLISVTAHNDSGSVMVQHSIDITGAYLYLPLIRK